MWKCLAKSKNITSSKDTKKINNLFFRNRYLGFETVKELLLSQATGSAFAMSSLESCSFEALSERRQNHRFRKTTSKLARKNLKKR
jgi:hypothetical protein